MRNHNNNIEMSQAKRTTSATRDEAPNQQQQQQQTHIVDKEITRINNGDIYENSETYDNLESVR